MLARLSSAALLGIDAYRVDVEVDVAPGLPGFQVVGLPHGAVREGRDRVLSALAHIDRAVPPRRIVVNLAPADVPKEGSAFDLPIALGLLAAAGAVPVASLADTVFVAELGLDGSLRPVRGALSVALLCVDERVRTLVLPRANAREASAIAGLEVLGADHLREVVTHLRGERRLGDRPPPPPRNGPPPSAGALAQIRGQPRAKRVLEIAAAGAHNLLLEGPPGAGKTLLARALPTLPPPLAEREAVEVTRVHSAAGL
ncbi:MAG: ATP-binding protein, partial [Gemmatimonadetes bacterium]|nr:ATP-binding protein [Gemmatimonadota bacterium]